MDELDLLTRHRPDPPPPTDAERATARAALMAHVAGDGRPVVDVTAPPRRTRRTLRRAVALAGVAAAVVTGLLVAGGSDRAPEQLRDRPATAAEQLRAVADAVTPYPDTPFAVRVRSVERWTGPEGRTDTNEALVHHARPGIWISDTSGCSTPCLPLIFPNVLGLPFAPDAEPAAVRAGIEGALRAQTAPDDDDGFVVQVHVRYLGDLLRHPAAGPTARAEVLRVLAEVPGLTATSGVPSAFGDEGTLFRIAGADGEETALLIDPSDGYVLERREAAPARGPAAGRAEGGDDTGEDVLVHELGGGPRGDFSEVTTYERPVAGPLPDVVESLAAVVAEEVPTASEGIPADPTDAARCTGEVGPTTGEEDGTLGIPVPEGLAYTYCAQV